ncbi:unnamed protein product [Ranitomeya imitator]|uniref:RBPJ-interacting and tubulin-associated protein 1 n=1 Tax=Ranitomeya imitator TaxID=111125 RepID=A0ABN9KZQ3_9NEOB|nr:unnamed protein product [Ranitomeya imitator]
MFTLVTGIVGRWRAVCVTALQRPNSDAAAIRIVVGIAAASLSVTLAIKRYQPLRTLNSKYFTDCIKIELNFVIINHHGEAQRMTDEKFINSVSERVDSQILDSRTPILSDVDMSLDLSITGQRTSLPPKKRSSYRYKASNSFVDETLFGSSGGKVDPALQWTIGTPAQESYLRLPEENKSSASNATARTACSPVGTPRKRTQYSLLIRFFLLAGSSGTQRVYLRAVSLVRAKSRSPSYCDESLFGTKIEDCSWEAPWVKKEDSIRIRPLLWSPPPVMRPQNSKVKTNQIPVRAVHPPDDRNGAIGTHNGKGNFWKPPESGSDSGGCPSVCDPPASAKACLSSLRKDSSRSSSCSGRLTSRRGFLTDRPPWK